MLRLPRLSLLVVLLAALSLGCGFGRGFTKVDLDRARQGLETALESWKKGEQPDVLRALPEPIDFAEEWPRKGLKLLDYQIVGSNHTDTQTIRFTVKLDLRDQSGRQEQREATYAVALKSPIVIARDPYF